MTSSPAPPQRWDARLWGALILLCGVVFLDGLDVSMVGVALPSIQADLGLTTSQLQWVISAYVLGLGGVLLLGGRASDLLGRRRVLIGALTVFTVASLAGGLVQDGTLLIAARFLKGVAAAFTVPAALSLITTTFTEGPARNKALAIFNAFGASGFSFGLVFGGLLTSVGWRWTFLLPVPVALILLALVPRYIARDRPYLGPKRRYDIPGAVLLTAGMLLLVRTIVEAPETGWAAAETLAASRSPPACWPPSWWSSAGPPSRWCGSGSSAPLRSCGRTSARCACSAPTWASSSSPPCTCRARWAGARSRPRWRSCRAACSSPSAPRAWAR